MRYGKEFLHRKKEGKERKKIRKNFAGLIEPPASIKEREAHWSKALHAKTLTRDHDRETI